MATDLSAITALMKQFVEQQKIAGAVVAVSQFGQTEFCEAVGFQNIEENLPMQRETIFRIYSMTKPVTAVAALLLIDRGEIDLDDPLSRFDSRFGQLRVLVESADSASIEEALKQPLTVRDLLQHTSGFTYGKFGITEVDRLYRSSKIGAMHKTLDENCAELAKLPLVHQPGETFRYSVASDVLGHVIERVSGQPLDAFFRSEIFDPLGMKDTSFQLPAEKLDRFAANYGPRLRDIGLRRIGNPTESRFLRTPVMLSGGGGLLSTADDFMKFCHLLVGEGKYTEEPLLKPETIRAMATNQLPPSVLPIAVAGSPFRGVGFGLGVSVRVETVEYAPHIPVGEYGWSGAASTHFWISPQHDLATVVLTQHMPYTPALADEVKRLVYEAIDEQ